MLKRAIISFAVLAGLAAPALPAGSCEPQKLAAAIDIYASAPFSARSWRMLKGLGDPMIEPGYPDSDNWAEGDEWKKLVGDIAPDAANLQDPAYDCRIGYPLSVLKERIKALGKDSVYVKHWLVVEDKVLEACDTPDESDLTIPDPISVKPALAQMQRDDRAYQTATMAFYRNKEKALELFRAIGKSTSPHRGAALYNVANLLANDHKFDEARATAQAILDDPSLSAVHTITRELMGFLANLADTAADWTKLIDTTIATIEAPKDQILAGADAAHEYANALYDIEYAGIRGKADDWWLDGTLPENPTISKAILDASRKHPIALWMLAGQSANRLYEAGPWSLIGGKWEERTASLITKALAIKPAADGLPPAARAMLTALAAKPDDDSRAALWTAAHKAMDAAATSCGSDPQTAAAGFLLHHAIRLSAMAGDDGQALTELEKVPFKTASSFYDATLVGYGQYLLGQGKLVEARALRDRIMTPAFMASLPETDSSDDTSNRYAGFLGWIAEDEAHWTAALALKTNKLATMLLNFLPADKLLSYADNAMFSPAEKGVLARAAWTRSYATGQTPPENATSKLLELSPEIKATMDKVAADYATASAADRLLLTILRSPRLTTLVTAPGLSDGLEAERSDFNEIENYDANDKNWWCSFATDRQLGGLRTEYDAALGLDSLDYYGSRILQAVIDQPLRDATAKARETVLRGHPMVKAIDWKEIDALAAAPTAPKLFSAAAIKWGKASTGGDGAPEALALAVRTTRYGCRWDGRHGAYSKPAQELLRKKFGDTQWAKDTPYWFDCERFEWNADSSDKVRVCEAKTWPAQVPLK